MLMELGANTKLAKKRIKSRVIIVLTLVAVAALGAAAYVKVHQKPTADSTADTKVHSGPATDKSTKSQAAQTTTTTSNPSHPQSALAKPIGPNNNTGSVSLSGNTMMESTCRSVAGASCFIRATMGSAVKTVSETKVVGNEAYSDGVVLDWDANQLSTGTWMIQAIASKDSQEAVSDPQSLKVTP